MFACPGSLPAAITVLLATALPSPSGAVFRPTSVAPDESNGIILNFHEWVLQEVVGEFEIGSHAGRSVAIDGNRVAIGIPEAQGGNGRVQLWERNGDSWTFVLQIAPPAADSQFGAAVDLSGNTLIVGAPNYSVGGVEGVGAAYIYDDLSSGISPQLITADDISPDGAPRFGFSVALSGNVAIIGAPYARLGVDAFGYVEFFRRSATDWESVGGFFGGDAGEQFGNALDIVDRRSLFVDLEDYAVVGSPGRDLGPNGPFVAGAATFFKISPDGDIAPQPDVPFPAPVTFNAFGSAIALTSTRLVVGAPGRDLHGTALTYRIQNRTWQFDQELGPVAGETFDRFGGAVALSGERLAIGADGDDVETDGGATVDAGSVYFFHDISGFWLLNDKEHLRTMNANDRYGSAVAIDGIQAIVGGEHVMGGGVSNSGIAVTYIVDSIFRDGVDS